VASDFNRDGKIDLAVANTCGKATSCNNSPGGSVSVLLGAGDGTFAVSSIVLSDHSEPLGIEAGDFIGNGKIDLAVVGSSALIIPGNGKGDFENPVPMVGWSPEFSGYLAVGDFNGDGRLDFAENNPADVQGNGSVVVQMQSPVAFYPAVLRFPPQNVGTTSSPKTVRFANVGISPVNISKVEVAGYYAGTNDCPATLPVGADCTVTVTFTPGFVGLTGGLVWVYDDAIGTQQSSELIGVGK
jgi:hypothetical protein